VILVATGFFVLSAICLGTYVDDGGGFMAAGALFAFSMGLLSTAVVHSEGTKK